MDGGGNAILPADVAIGRAEGMAPKDIGRWRMDAWLFLREGSSRFAAGGPQPATLGASQYGGVLSYRLSRSARRPVDAYLRVTGAFAATASTELATGLRVRPLAEIPIAMHAEMRATQYAKDKEIRPSAFLAGGIDEARLPLGLEVSGYGQAGYVGGRYRSWFADGRVVMEREVFSAKPADMRIGAGVWGGAQEGASRIDIGPTARVDLQDGPVPLRLLVDYRFRMAGRAQPAAGAALTLSTGF